MVEGWVEELVERGEGRGKRRLEELAEEIYASSHAAERKRRCGRPEVRGWHVCSAVWRWR